MPFWRKASYKDEVKAFEKTVSSLVVPFTPRDEYIRKKIDLQIKIAAEYENSRHVVLTNTVWRKLDNSESWLTNTFIKFNREVTRKANDPEIKNIDDDFKVIGDLIQTAPIILHIKTGTILKDIRKNSPIYRVVSGNNRLMLYRLMGINPRVVIIEL